jgi:hypothetical protein
MPTRTGTFFRPTSRKARHCVGDGGFVGDLALASPGQRHLREHVEAGACRR